MARRRVHKADVTENGGALSILETEQAASFGEGQLIGRGGRNLVARQEELHWYALQTRSRHEKRIQGNLQEKGIQAYLPLSEKHHQWSDRRKLVDEPLFPGYVFVKIAPDAQSRVPVLRTTGVIGFLGVRGVGIPIPESEISAIRTLLQENVEVRSHPYLELGKRVRICGGSLDGLEGILTGMEGTRGLVVSVQVIQKSVEMRISGYTIVPV